MKYIVNGKLILKDRIVCGKAIAYDGKIQNIIDTDKVPADAEIIDAKGNYVAPGLIDIHIHGYLGCDVCDAKTEGIRTIAGGLVKNGVTGFLATTMTVSMEVIQKSVDSVRAVMEESKTWNGSTVLGVHAEGPFINKKKKGAQEEAFILKPDANFVIKNADVVKYITLAPEMDEGFSAIREIVSETDTVVSVGHTDANYETASASVDAGVKSSTHLFNAMTALNHRNPGVVGAALTRDIYTELIVDTYHVDKALFSMVAKLKGDKLVFITDCLPAGGLPEGQYTLGNQKVFYYDNLCKLEDGTIAGSVLKLNKGVLNVFESTDLPLWQCVRCATLNPATLLGIADKKGSLEIGKDADIIIANEKFDILKTIIGGTLRYEA
ncbi:MAG: N-acetylglucosamine-6-phosphate deacetylase [Eubacteriales bacterium]|nr:N-acetylglucosamine-6-phosphate deacetylase [Eubacteriales bacterium]